MAIALSWIPAGMWILMSGNANKVALQPWAPILTLDYFITSNLAAIWTNGIENQWFFIIACVILLLTILLFYQNIKDHTRMVLSLIWIVPLFAMIGISVLWQNIIVYRRLMPMLFSFCLWLGWELMHRPIRSGKLALACSWILLLLFSVFTWNPADRGGYLDHVAAEMRSQFQTGDVVLYSTETVFLPMNYYLDDLPHYQWKIGEGGLLSEPDINLPNTGDLVTARRIWLVTPEESLLTADEKATIDTLIAGSQPIWQVDYLQMAPIDVYLVEETR
jgi:hypothetical protein